MIKMIDAHIHLDQYQDTEISTMMEEMPSIEAVISVSTNLESCKRNLQLAGKYPKVKPAFGFHPEQNLPAKNQLDELLGWVHQHGTDLVAIGEVGLPYYLRHDHKVSEQQYEQYIELLEIFIHLAKQWDKPIVLHAVYEDAPIVCEQLEKYSVTKAHFHWFKGDERTIAKMAENGYYISITPDVLYEEEIQQLVQVYPLEQMMVETDGPWPFKGPFKGKRTHPNMVAQSIRKIAEIKELTVEEAADQLLLNTKLFYPFE
jgi:TatD DNase family protein